MIRRLSEIFQYRRKVRHQRTEVGAVEVDGQLGALDGKFQPAVVGVAGLPNDGGVESLQFEHRALLGGAVLESGDQPKPSRQGGRAIEQKAVISIGGSFVRVIDCVAPNAPVRLHFDAGCAIDHLGNRHRGILLISNPDDMHVEPLRVEVCA